MLEKDFDISSRNSIFITDTTGDIEEAREVGYKSIGITGGVHPKKILESSKPLFIINNFVELQNRLEEY
jgi:phosphoglycolate phosphatase-like HAD superfamily hydrolase